MYDKIIYLYKRSDKPIIDNNGIVSYEYSLIREYNADVQPITKEKAKSIYGEFENCKYQIFIDELVELDSKNYIIEYKGIRYEVNSYIDWEDEDYPYTQILVSTIGGV